MMMELARGGSLGVSGAPSDITKKQPRDSGGDWEPTGKNMPAIPRRVVEKIKRGQYVDFSVLPPAAGSTRATPSHLEGDLVVIRAEDLARSRKLIPDIGVWLQCYVLWMSVALKEEPSRAQEFLAYAFLIAKCSKSFRWPSWILYDQEFRQARAGDRSSRWDEIDACLYTRMFTGRMEEGENWCTLCHSVDHTRKHCPLQGNSRRPLAAQGPPPAGQVSRVQGKAVQVCHKFNRFNGDCRRGLDCPYRHACSKCGGSHPVSRCADRGGLSS